MINKKILFLILLGGVLLPAMFVFADDTKVFTMATALADTAMVIGAAVVVIGWVITGILYLTATGKPEKINVAKSALIACVVGTILIILADATGNISGVIKDAFGIK